MKLASHVTSRGNRQEKESHGVRVTLIEQSQRFNVTLTPIICELMGISKPTLYKHIEVS
ncbi:MAG: hypothetical protein V3U88_02715 [Methylococcales bacterium]